MSVFFEIGRHCATTYPVPGHEKQAFGGALGNAAGKFFKFVGGHPRLAGGLGLGGALGAAGLNEAAAGNNLPHFGGTEQQPLWHPSSHGLATNPHTQGWGTAAWRAATRPLQTYRQMVGTNPKPTLANMISGNLNKPQYKFNPATGQVEITGQYGLHPMYQQQLERLKQQNKMFAELDPGFAEMLGLAKAEAAQAGAPAPGAAPGAAAAKPPATPPVPKLPETVRNAFGPLHMNDYTKVPNVPLPSVF